MGTGRKRTIEKRLVFGASKTHWSKRQQNNRTKRKEEKMTYFILINNQQQGPYTLDELRSRNITSATLVWREGMTDWTPAWKVAELVSLFHADAADKAQTTPPPAPSMGAATTGAATTGAATAGATGAATTDETATQGRSITEQLYADAQEDETMNHGNGHEEREEHKSHTLRNGCIGLILVLAAMAVGLVATCPTEQAHREAITKEMNRFIKESTDNQGDAWGIIGNIISQKIVGVVVDNLIEVDNYGVCSVGSITFKGKTHRVSFGILGHVFTFDADDIQRALENGSDASDIFHSPLNNPGDNDSSDDSSSDNGSTDGENYDNGSSSDDSGSSYDQQDGSADDGQNNGSSDSNEADGSDMSNM